VGLYVSLLGAIISLSLRAPGATFGLLALLLAIWFKVRSGRIDNWQLGKLEFEELPEPAVLTLSILRD
jgi:hypothetical protein